MKLYYTPGVCSMASHIVLRETGSTFDLEKVDLQSKKTEKGSDYTQVNPIGYVPALQLDDGSILTEGPAIMQYIADAKGATSILPKAGSPERYKVVQWLNFISTEIHKGFGPLFWPTTPQDFKDSTVKTRLAQRFDYLNKHLAQNQFLMGSQFTVADAYLYTTLTWSSGAKMDLTPFPNLVAYRDRVAARPAVQAARKAEGLPN
ncbi:MAG: glutathione transferase GstA [Alphaproteobacteria bacterium]|nr:glutathione transferase GstA [Alphaproteobacteria bacterium]